MHCYNLQFGQFELVVDITSVVLKLVRFTGSRRREAFAAIDAIAARLWTRSLVEDSECSAFGSDHEGEFWIAFEIQFDTFRIHAIEHDPHRRNPRRSSFLVRRDGLILGFRTPEPGEGPSAFRKSIISELRDAPNRFLVRAPKPLATYLDTIGAVRSTSRSASNEAAFDDNEIDSTKSSELFLSEDVFSRLIVANGKEGRFDCEFIQPCIDLYIQLSVKASTMVDSDDLIPFEFGRGDDCGNIVDGARHLEWSRGRPNEVGVHNEAFAMIVFAALYNKADKVMAKRRNPRDHNHSRGRTGRTIFIAHEDERQSLVTYLSTIFEHAMSRTISETPGDASTKETTVMKSCSAFITLPTGTWRSGCIGLAGIPNLADC